MILCALVIFVLGAAVSTAYHHTHYVGEGFYTDDHGNGIHYRCTASGAEEFPAGLPANVELRPGLCDGSAVRRGRSTNTH